ncbi:MAG: hypothetical protein AABW64_04895 [Nanoarchaeota archaeon]
MQNKLILFLIIGLIFSVRISADPSGWTNDKLVVSNNQSYTLQNPQTTMDFKGNLHMMWQDNRNYPNYDLFYKKLDNNGNNLTADIFISSASQWGSMHRIVSDKFGMIHIVFIGANTQYNELFYKKLNNEGKNLTGDISLSNAFAWWPNFAVDSKRNVYVVWKNKNGIGYKKLDSHGKNLTPELQITYDSSDGIGSIVLDGKNNVHLGWHRTIGPYNNQEIYYQKFDENLTALTNEIRLTQHSTSNSYSTTQPPILFLDKRENVHIAWQDLVQYVGPSLPNFEIIYSKLNNNGTQIINKTQISNNKEISQNPSMVVDACGFVRVAWQQETILGKGEDEIYYAELNSDGKNITEEIRLTNASKESEIPSLTVDRNGRSHIVWQDNRNGTYSSYNWEVYYKRSLSSIRKEVC